MATSKKADKTQQALLNDLQKAVDEAETMLKDVAGKGEAETAEVKEKINKVFKKAMDSFNDAQESAVEQGREVAQKTQAYVHENPWQTIGIAGVAGLLLGVLISRR